MKLINYITASQLKNYTALRDGEQKWGERLQIVKDIEQLDHLSQKYILLGIPEDIGVRANNGRAGASEAWEAFLKTICNLQVNKFNLPDSVAVLGTVNVLEEMKQAESITFHSKNYKTEFGALVQKINEKVYKVIESIVANGKIPIVIGGGHNNAYGLLKGSSRALKTTINCINLDAHTDLRPLEHWHSGNGFSYAKKDGFLNEYHIFGLHKNFTPQSIFEQLPEHSFTLFETLLEQPNRFIDFLEKAINNITNKPFGVEIDLDAIAYMGSSAQSPSGFTLEEARKYVKSFKNEKNLTYFHFCEGAPCYEVFNNQIGKALAYLVSDVAV